MDLGLPYRVEYTPSDAPGKCKKCKREFVHHHIRLAKMVQSKHHDAEVPHWYHRKCFFECHQVKSGDEIEYLERMKYDDQQTIQDSVEIKSIDVADTERQIAIQVEKLRAHRERIRRICSLDDMKSILDINGSCQVKGYNNTIDRCTDFMTFGALCKCKKCKEGHMMFTKDGYTCNGSTDGWVKCGNFEVKPRRKKCLIPEGLDEDYQFFADYIPIIANRVVRTRVLKREEMTDSIAAATVTAAVATAAKKETEIHFKNGTVVDPKSELSKTTHVYKYKGIIYSIVVTRSDIERNKNSFFKLQILESDKNQSETRYWLFTSWGRIGTDREGSRVERAESAFKASRKFEKLFEAKTGNSWKSPNGFKKIPDKFFPIDVDYSDVVRQNTKIASKLSTQVEELMKLIFNVQTMTKAMTSYKLDVEKMPLGKLSDKQLTDAREALDELKKAIDKKSSPETLIGLSNKFYSFVPHSFGLAKAQIIDKMDLVNQKIDLVDSLQKIQQAYAIMLQSPNADINSFDSYYSKLNAVVTHVDPKSYGYTLIERYVKNTTVHETKLQILEVFSVNRNGEKKRYEPFEKHANRMLLWHGSATINFASILSNGLKISPAANGSMFGRGLYFADMVSKSANYCRAAPPDNTILLALSEVALGKMHELRQASNALVKAPAGTDSVKGIGRVQPDLKYAKKRKNGVVIPYGRPDRNPSATAPPTVLAYNEFIVYNEAQVNIQYLVKIKVG